MKLTIDDIEKIYKTTWDIYESTKIIAGGEDFTKLSDTQVEMLKLAAVLNQKCGFILKVYNTPPEDEEIDEEIIGEVDITDIIKGK